MLSIRRVRPLRRRAYRLLAGPVHLMNHIQHRLDHRVRLLELDVVGDPRPTQ